MTATEQLAIWAAAPNDEVFVWMQYPKNEDIFFNLGFGDMPDQVGRMRARDVLAAFQRTPNATNRIADVLARFQKIPDGGNSIRADEIKGIACVIVEGTAPGSPRSPYRVLVSSVGSFT